MKNYVGKINKNGKQIVTSTSALNRYDAIVKLSNHYDVRQKDIVSCRATK